MKFNGFQSNHEDIANRIIDSYNKGEHISLKKFLEKMDNEKNVIYTFSNILDVVKNINDIDNKMIGNINKDNIKELKISSFKSENEFEKEIDDFFESDQKLCFIKFTANEGNFLNYIKFFIENKEKEYKTNIKGEIQKKIFIFIVHLSRVFNSDLDNYEKKKKEEQNEINKKILKETISLLSGYYQIFIDNLNGDENISLDNIVNLKGTELFKKCLDFDNILMENIYNTIYYINYNILSSFRDLNKGNYIKKLITFLDNDKNLRDDINKCILNQINKEEHIIIKVFKTENSVSQNDIDMIGVIQKYLSELYIKHLHLLYFKAEQDQFFSSLLSFNEKKPKPKVPLVQIFEEGEDEQNKNKKINNLEEEEYNETIKEIIRKAKAIYLEKLIYTEINEEKLTKFEEEEGKKNVDIILGLKLPGLYPVINNFIIKFRNERQINYNKNEYLLRDNDYENNGIEEKKKYLTELKKMDESTFIIISKNELLLKIIDNDEYKKKELFDLLIE